RIEAQEGPHLVWIVSFQPAQQLGIVLVANSEHDELNALAQQCLSDGSEQVEPLLRAEAADHAHQRHLGINRQRCLALQGQLVLSPPFQVLEIVVHWNVRIGGRIEYRRIDAIENAEETILALAEQWIQALSILG